MVDLFTVEQGKRLFTVIAGGRNRGCHGRTATLRRQRTADRKRRRISRGAALFVLAVRFQGILIHFRKGSPDSSRDGEADHQSRSRDWRVIPFGNQPCPAFALSHRSRGLRWLLDTITSTWAYFQQSDLAREALKGGSRAYSRGSTGSAEPDHFDAALHHRQDRFAFRVGGAPDDAFQWQFSLVWAMRTAPVWNTFAVLAITSSSCVVASELRQFVRPPAGKIIWTPMDKRTKYKAKNFVDVPVYRGADAAVAELQRALEGAGLGAQTVALLGALGAIFWAGKRLVARAKVMKQPPGKGAYAYLLRSGAARFLR